MSNMICKYYCFCLSCDERMHTNHMIEVNKFRAKHNGHLGWWREK